MPDSAAVNHHRLLKRALLVWFVLIGVEFVHGALRAIFLVPVVGDHRSRHIGVFTGSVLILLVAYLVVPWLHADKGRALISVGVLWLVLTVAFEFSFGHYVFRRSWGDVASDYDPFQGGFLLIGMAVLMFAPVIAARMRGCW